MFQVEGELLRHAPLFSSLGNHELNHHNYFDAFCLPENERWHSFDYGHAHFVCLQIDGFSNYRRGSERHLWPEEDLASTEQPRKFVFLHIPPCSSGPHGSDLQVRTALHPLFVQHSVDVVFNAHDHDYERTMVNGVSYIVAAGGRAIWAMERKREECLFESTLHFLSTSIAEHTLTSRGVRPDGGEFDPFILTAHQRRE